MLSIESEMKELSDEVTRLGSGLSQIAQQTKDVLLLVQQTSVESQTEFLKNQKIMANEWQNIAVATDKAVRQLTKKVWVMMIVTASVAGVTAGAVTSVVYHLLN